MQRPMVVVQATKLEPGDKMFMTTDVADCDELRQMVVVLKSRFPGVQFTLLTEVTGVFKYEGDLVDVSESDAATVVVSQCDTESDN